MKHIEPQELHRYEQYSRRTPSFGRSSSVSLLWEREIKRFLLPLRQEGASVDAWLRRLDAAVENSDFAFQSLKPRLGAQWLRLAFLLDIVRYGVIALAARATRFVSSRPFEHAQALCFLHRRGMLRSYFLFINSIGIVSSMQVARYYYYLMSLKRFGELNENRPLQFLEIGAGAGGFALMAFGQLHIARYVVIDLPEMIGYASYQFLRYRPDIRVVYPHEFTPESLTGSEHSTAPTIFFITPEQAAALPDDFFDVTLNCYSFSEMEYAVIVSYFSLVYRVGAPRSIFFHVNRFQLREQRDGVVAENNPFLFPYCGDDEVLHFSIDRFYATTRGGIGIFPKPTVMSVRRIKPGKTIPRAHFL
ncbi:MAG: putative sugar O-methyltransferase [bacterium]|nr:putative sugar O-methyltransferase [bacterium]MDZ4295931.1 putative sugar O-methyltransferase [Patescibacteria group bacterium]